MSLFTGHLRWPVSLTAAFLFFNIIGQVRNKCCAVLCCLRIIDMFGMNTKVRQQFATHTTNHFPRSCRPDMRYTLRSCQQYAAASAFSLQHASIDAIWQVGGGIAVLSGKYVDGGVGILLATVVSQMLAYSSNWSVDFFIRLFATVGGLAMLCVDSSNEQVRDCLSHVHRLITRGFVASYTVGLNLSL
jgi:hypothetical protein